MEMCTKLTQADPTSVLTCKCLRGTSKAFAEPTSVLTCKCLRGTSKAFHVMGKPHIQLGKYLNQVMKFFFILYFIIYG